MLSFLIHGRFDKVLENNLCHGLFAADAVPVRQQLFSRLRRTKIIHYGTPYRSQVFFYKGRLKVRFKVQLINSFCHLSTRLQGSVLCATTYVSVIFVKKN